MTFLFIFKGEGIRKTYPYYLRFLSSYFQSFNKFEDLEMFNERLYFNEEAQRIVWIDLFV